MRKTRRTKSCIMYYKRQQFHQVHLACLVGTVVRRWTTVLEVVGSLPALAKQRIKFLGLLRLPARVEQ